MHDSPAASSTRYRDSCAKRGIPRGKETEKEHERVDYDRAGTRRGDRQGMESRVSIVVERLFEALERLFEAVEPLFKVVELLFEAV